MSDNSLFILLCSSEHEKIQMAAMIASVAAVSERPVTVFVSMGAVQVFEAGLSADERYTGATFSNVMKDKKAPDALELFSQGKMLGDLKMYVCSMALDVLGWDEGNLVEDLFEGPMGLTRFLDVAEKRQIVTL
ncbi:MAG: DsrE/DsrF/DrsH-like family protein [Rhodospirillales bacterium]|nr:DsrE/DsrF/DrsH-like family protein [Rhodospirillales bacterium]